RFDRALVTAIRPLVLIFARDFQFFSHFGTMNSHVNRSNRALETIVQHCVFERCVSHALAEASSIGIDEIRRLAHRLHAAGDYDISVSRANAQVANGYGTYA